MSKNLCLQRLCVRWRGVVRALAWVAGVGVLQAAEPEVDLKELVRFPPLEPEQALRSFKVKPGFRLELAAAEPLVRSPIEVCFDENGRMFVVEMIDYSELRNEKPHLGRIRMLEDVDGDGRYDRATVYVDDLPWPTGVICWKGGVFVTATPDVYYCRDTDGDGRADERRRVFTGFGIDFAPYGVKQLNMQAMVNGLRWGLDNRVHGMTGPNGGVVTMLAHPGEPAVDVHGRDFRFDPVSLRLEAEAGGGQYGMSFDDQGRRFTCNNSDHLRVFQFDPRYGVRNPYAPVPSPLVSVAADGPAATVYRRSPDEPWRVIRTRWRVSGQVPGLIEGGGRASGYFTSATGLTVYRGDAWPSGYVGDVFVADCGSNLVHRKKVRREGVGFVGERPADERDREFLASTDTWFRPVELVNGPDGNLYVVDMYREIIEHPWSLPESLKKHLDLNSGSDRGRVYRVVPERYRRRPLPRLGKASTSALVGLLSHPNAWQRETASRLLYERQDGSAVPRLEKVLRGRRSGVGQERGNEGARLVTSAATAGGSDRRGAVGRLHALHALDGLGALSAVQVLCGLGDEDAVVREHAVRLAERFLGDAIDGVRVTERMLAMVDDASPDVRYQLVFSLGGLDDARVTEALERVFRRDRDDAWVRSAVLVSLVRGRGEFFRRVWQDGAWCRSADGRGFMGDLAHLIGADGTAEEVEVVVGAAVGAAGDGQALELARRLGGGARQSGRVLPLDRMGPLRERAEQLAQADGVEEGLRLEAIGLLGVMMDPGLARRLAGLLRAGASQELQLAVVKALGACTGAEVGTLLVERWPGLTPRLREEAMRVLVGRGERLPALYGALREGVVRTTELTTNQRQFLLGHRDEVLREQAKRLLEVAAPTSDRQAVVDGMRAVLPASGDAAKGRAIFAERCVSCHRLGGLGSSLGPDLTSVKASGREKLLVSLLDPNRELLPQYVAYEVEMDDEETMMGLVVNETTASVTLRQPYGREVVVPRKRIVRMQSQGRSLMPEELETGLTPAQFADLMEFVLTAEAGK